MSYLARQKRKKNRAKRREEQIKSYYNMDPDEYKLKLKLCNEQCEICGLPLINPCIDHNHSCCPRQHSCGKCVRGLLCPKCNSGLGMYNDNIEILKNAIRYLEKYELKTLSETGSSINS